jgi:hypothetical protein
MKPIMDLLVQTLGPALFVVLVGGAALGLVIGILLVIDSERVMRWNGTLNRWYSTQAVSTLDRSIDIKRPLYRWHRVIGVLLFAAALYTLDVLVFGFHGSALVRALRGTADPGLLSIGLEALRLFLVVGNVAALVAAAILAFRPSLLKGLEGWGDRQYSVGMSTQALDAMHYQPDRFVRGRPKLVGGILAVGSAYVLITLGFLVR